MLTSRCALAVGNRLVISNRKSRLGELRRARGSRENAALYFGVRTGPRPGSRFGSVGETFRFTSGRACGGFVRAAAGLVGLLGCRQERSKRSSSALLNSRGSRCLRSKGQPRKERPLVLAQCDSASAEAGAAAGRRNRKRCRGQGLTPARLPHEIASKPILRRWAVLAPTRARCSGFYRGRFPMTLFLAGSGPS